MPTTRGESDRELNSLDSGRALRLVAELVDRMEADDEAVSRLDACGGKVDCVGVEGATSGALGDKCGGEAVRPAVNKSRIRSCHGLQHTDTGCWSVLVFGVAVQIDALIRTSIVVKHKIMGSLFQRRRR